MKAKMLRAHDHSRMLRWVAACGLLSACGNAPSYTLPASAEGALGTASDADVAPEVTVVQTASGVTSSIAATADQLCAIQTLSGMLHGYEGDDASADATVDAAALTETGVSLYIDSESQWRLTAQGNVSAAVGCVPWSAFASGAQTLVQYEAGGTFADASDPVGKADLQGHLACFLSGVEGDFSDQDNTANIDGSALLVSNAAAESAVAAAICMAGPAPVSFADYTMDARTFLATAMLPSPDQALCAISAIGAMNASDSTVQISGGNAVATHAWATIRCFFYGAGGGQ